MVVRLSVTEAAASLDSLLDRVATSGDTIIIEREGKAIGQIVPAAPAEQKSGTVRDLVEILRNWPRADDGWAEGVEEAIRLGNQPMPPESPWDR